MATRRARILILNAALAGEAGNTAAALEIVERALSRGGGSVVRVVTLAANGSGKPAAGVAGALSGAGKGFVDVKAELAWADAFVVGTGTHWDSWSSVLQKFLEDATEAEGTTLWLGKPAACVVTEHGVGGKGVLSRLQGVLVTLGCMIPPMSGVVLSKVAQMAARRSEDDERGLAKGAKDAKAGRVKEGMARAGGGSGTEDFWCAEDLKIVAHNLVEAVRGTRKWRAWAVDREDFSARWMA